MTDPVAEATAIRSLEAQGLADFNSKDANRIVAHYTDDTTLLAPNTAVVHGKAAAAKAFKPMISDPNFKLDFAPDRVEVANSGDLAYAQGHYTLQMTDPASKKPTTDRGKYLTVYRRQADRSWKVIEDMYNSDLPPAPAPAPTKAAKNGT